MYSLKKGNLVLTCAILILAKLVKATEMDDFEVLTNESHPARKEFENHTETCFKLFRSSLVKLAVLFLDPGSESKSVQQESKCWIKCMLEQFKFIEVVSGSDGSETGEIIRERIMERTSDLSPSTRSKLSEIIAKCDEYSKAAGDVCNKAFSFARCVFQSYRAKYVIPMTPVVPVVQPAVVVTG